MTKMTYSAAVAQTLERLMRLKTCITGGSRCLSQNWDTVVSAPGPQLQA
jgi:hypothetical protein